MSTNAQPAHRRGVFSSLLVILLASIVLFSRAQLVQSSFEEALSSTWRGPEGGGWGGGDGAGLIVDLGKEEFVRTGQRAVRLCVWDDGSPEAAAWAGVMQVLPCSPRRKVHVGAWLYFSSKVLPLRGEACAQLKIEYFEDDQARRLIPSHIFLSPPCEPVSYKPDTWHLIQATDRAPQCAKSLKFSVVVTARKLAGRREAVWLDDMFVEMPPHPPGPKSDAGARASL